MKKTAFYTELAYVLGIVTIALGVAFMEKADFGVSMVVAPAYLFYLKLSQTFSFVTFGMMEYAFQAVLLLLMTLILHKFRLSYLFSFFTAVVYGFVLDGCMALVAPMSAELFAWRVVFYIIGLLLCAVGVACMFHTYISPEVYELFVKEVSSSRHIEVGRVKTIYDCSSFLLAVALSFLFFGFGHFEGIKLGTVVCAVINGRLIGWISAWMDGRFAFKDALSLRKYFS